MTSGALFGPSSGIGGSSGGNKNLVEFRAGRMTLKGRMVHPDKRKGLLYVYQGEDSLMHFCWKDRTTGEVEDDLLIFPDDCEFARVDQCTTGRVYVLKFKSFTRKYFFWMQEPKADKDEEYCRRINEVLNNPPAAGRGAAGGSGGGGAPDGDLQNLLNNMSQQQLMQLFGGVGQIGGLSSLLGTMGNGSRSSTAGSSRGSSVSRSEAAPRTPARSRAAPAATTPPTTATPPATATPPTTAPTPTQPRAGQAVVLSDLQRYFSGLERAPPNLAVQSSGLAAPPGLGEASVDLAGALASTQVAVAASEPAAAERLTTHLPTLPDQEGQDEVRATLLSPHFAQAATLFSSALSSGQLAPVVSQFGLGSDAVSAASSGDIHAFFKALEGQGSTCSESDKPEAQEEAKKEDKPKDDKGKVNEDDDMSVE